MSDRVLEPKCRHKRRGRVVSGEYVKDEPYASTAVCDRPGCIDDAIRWANQTVLARSAHYIPDGAR